MISEKKKKLKTIIERETQKHAHTETHTESRIVTHLGVHTKKLIQILILVIIE